MTAFDALRLRAVRLAAGGQRALAASLEALADDEQLLLLLRRLSPFVPTNNKTTVAAIVRDLTILMESADAPN